MTARITSPRADHIQVVAESDPDESTTNVQYQFGLRMPDGTYVWDSLSVASPTRTSKVDLADVANAGESESWATSKLQNILTEQARSAHANVERYLEATQLVRRAVILVVDTPEDI